MKFAVIGTGRITEELLRCGKSFPDFEPYAVLSRSAERGREYAERHGLTRCVTTLSELAALREVEAVYIASPNVCHAAQAEAMLSAGKHVFLEKPAVPTEAELKRLYSIADRRGLVLMEGMRTLHTPGFRALREALPRVGTLRRASISYCQYSRRYDNYRRGVVENAFDPTLCNGALMDIGVYCCASAVALFGEPEDVRCGAWKLDNGLDAMGTVLCLYDGFLCDLTYGKISDTRRPSEIQGESGTLLYDPPTNPSRIVFVSRTGERETVYSDGTADFYGMEHELRDFLAAAAHPAGAAENTALCRAESLAAVRLTERVRRELDINFKNTSHEGGARG